MSAPISGLLARWLARLRFPRLFVLALVLFGVDLVVPDLIPFADEVLLGVGTALLAAWRRERGRRAVEGPSEEGGRAGGAAEDE